MTLAPMCFLIPDSELMFSGNFSVGILLGLRQRRFSSEICFCFSEEAEGLASQDHLKVQFLFKVFGPHSGPEPTWRPAYGYEFSSDIYIYIYIYIKPFVKVKTNFLAIPFYTVFCFLSPPLFLSPFFFPFSPSLRFIHLLRTVAEGWVGVFLKSHTGPCRPYSLCHTHSSLPL